jgi:hypothetical protein
MLSKFIESIWLIFVLSLIFTSTLYSENVSLNAKENVLGVWKTTHEVFVAFKPEEMVAHWQKTGLLQPGENRTETVILTFHPKGVISSSGNFYGNYEFLGDFDLKFTRGNGDPKYVVIDFPTHDTMIWYIDGKPNKSFARINKKEHVR